MNYITRGPCQVSPFTQYGVYGFANFFRVLVWGGGQVSTNIFVVVNGCGARVSLMFVGQGLIWGIAICFNDDVWFCFFFQGFGFYRLYFNVV